MLPLPDRYGKPLAWAGCVVLAASLAVGILAGNADTPEKPPAREMELFAFIRALPANPAVSAASAPDSVPVSLPGLRSLFDRILAMQADMPAETLRAKAAQELRMRIPAEAVTPAIALFDRYARFTRESEALLLQIEAAADVATLRLHLHALRMLRERHFTTGELDTLFVDDPAYERLLAAQMEIRTDSSSSEEQRHARMVALEGSVPAGVRAVEAARTGIVRVDTMATASPIEGEEDVYRAQPAGNR